MSCTLFATFSLINGVQFPTSWIWAGFLDLADHIVCKMSDVLGPPRLKHKNLCSFCLGFLRLSLSLPSPAPTARCHVGIPTYCSSWSQPSSHHCQDTIHEWNHLEPFRSGHLLAQYHWMPLVNTSWSGIASWALPKFLDPPPIVKINNCWYFKSLCFKVICYTALDNWNSSGNDKTK